MLALLLSFVPPTTDRRAVTALEYGLIAGVLVAVVLAGFGVLGNAIQTSFDNIAADLT